MSVLFLGVITFYLLHCLEIKVKKDDYWGEGGREYDYWVSYPNWKKVTYKKSKSSIEKELYDEKARNKMSIIK